MEKISGLDDFPFVEFDKTAGSLKCLTRAMYYSKKNNIIRMYDENHVIKVSGNNLEYLILLKSLNIEQVNSPNKILQDENDDKFYTVSKYLEDCLELNFWVKNFLPFDEILDYFIQALYILERCHQHNFYPYDLHTSNILINQDKKVSLFDFDSSLFIKDKIISGNKQETLYSLYENPIIKKVLNDTYGINEDNLSFYNSNIQLIKPFFREIDKEYIIREIIRIILLRLEIRKDEYDVTKRDLTKLYLSKELEKKLINCLVKGNPLDYNDYLIDELNELKESRLVRSKLNKCDKKKK